ncbi:VWA domain-containing protein [Taibaiella helva]|uniref:VWA domain-containing protein n=1 Tax=Taibaiella helva TaxID=2301235 RepID=UPI000E587134|nr:VWA domain-containing protein [Taibaiella helva]
MEARDNFTEQFTKAARKQEDTSVAFPSMEQIWSKVEERLDAVQEEELQQKRLIPFWKKGIAAAVLLLAGIGLIYIISRPGDKPQDPSYARQDKGRERSTAGKATVPAAGTVSTPPLVQQEGRPVQQRKTVRQHFIAPTNRSHRTDIAARGPRSISGQVLDDQGKGVPGASVKVKGTQVGTVSDIDGYYSLEVPAGAEALQIWGIGMKEKEIDLSNISGPVIARLDERADNLAAVEIYGKKIDKRESVSSISNVTAEQIVKRPITNLITAPDGNAAGVNASQGYSQSRMSSGSKRQQAREQKLALNEKPGHMKLPEPVPPAGAVITSGGGQPGTSSDIVLRGFGSLSASNVPLIVVDGKVYEGDLKTMDPNTVASMSVLKDATTTALYGARGANGVILITTKKNAELQKTLVGKKQSFFGRTWYKVKKLFKGKKGRYSFTPAVMPEATTAQDDESYNPLVENPFDSPAREPLSTFSIDVDNAAYTNIRRFINNGQEVPKDAVRIEEMINFFRYHYPQPQDQHPFAIHTEYSDAPWNPQHRLLKIGLQGKTIPEAQLPAANLVFLIDVSGSMSAGNKLPLLKASMRLLLGKLRSKDKVAIVVYAGAAGLVLPSTPGDQKEKIAAALDMLQAGGSTAGGEGIRLAYQVAREHFIKDGNNRVILATDGDFNVGASSDADMQRLIEEQRKSNVFLTCLGYGMGNYKDSKMETLADKGNGNYAYIDDIGEANRFLVKAFGGTMYSIAKDVKLQIEFNPAYVQAYRLIGYENRKLRTEDFANDAIDAGELGSGHTVTALYEIIPVGIQSRFLPQAAPELKYKGNGGGVQKGYPGELATIRFRYKRPQEDKSLEIVKAIGYQPVPLASSSGDYKLAAAVAWFGLRLRDSGLVPDKNKMHIQALAESSLAANNDEYSTELVRLIREAK